MHLLKLLQSIFYVLLQNLRCMEHFEICMGLPIQLKFCILFSRSRTRVRKSRYSGETLQSPIHRYDVTKLPYLFSGEL